MKSNLNKLFKTDEKMEKEGIYFEVDSTTAFKIRRFNDKNPRAKAAMANHFKPYARQIELGTVDPEKMREINVMIFVDVCLAGWEGVLDENEKPIEFNRANAIELLKELPDLFDTLWKHANNFENYREDLGNS